MTKTTIKKTSGIDKFVREYTPGIVEEEKLPQLIGETAFQELWEKYETFLKIEGYGDCMDYLEKLTEVLSSEEMSAFLQATAQCCNKKSYAAKTSEFFKQLIQNSREAEITEFDLNGEGLFLKRFLTEYHSRFPWKIRYRGDLSDYNFQSIHNMEAIFEGRAEHIFSFLYYCNVRVEGEVGECGGHCINSSISVKGKVTGNFGSAGRDCKFYLDGTAGSYCGSHGKSNFYQIKGEVGHNCGYMADRSTYEIVGKVGDACGQDARKCDFWIDGEVGNNLGEIAKSSRFYLQGQSGDYVGFWSRRGRFRLNGDTGTGLGMAATDSTFDIFGRVKEKNLAVGAKNCLFRTDNKGTLEKLLASVPLENKIVYIDDGKHRTERENFMRNPSSVQDYRSTIERVWQKYQQVVQDPEMEAAANLNDVLSADEILLLSEVTPTDKKRGTFFNRLIRNSTYSGEREFQIEGPLYGDSFQGCENIQVDNSGDVGEEYGKLCRNSKFIIGGYAGNHLGYRARGSTFHVKRSVGRECGRLARKCHFTIEGDTYSRCGASAEDSTFVVKGNTYMSFGYRAKNCTFQLHGKALHIQGLGAKAENCTFKTPNKETLEKMLKAIPTEVGTHFETPRQSYNKIVFIHEDGREEKII